MEERVFLILKKQRNIQLSNKDLFSKIIKKCFDNYKYIKGIESKYVSDLYEIFRGTDIKLREDYLKTFFNIEKMEKEEPKNLVNLWSVMNSSEQNEYEKNLMKIIELTKHEPEGVSIILKYTDYLLLNEIIEQNEKTILEIVEKDLDIIWEIIDERIQDKYFMTIWSDIKLKKDENGNDVFNISKIKDLIINTKNERMLDDFFEKLAPQEQKIVIEPMIEKYCNEANSGNQLIKYIKILDKDIDAKGIAELLMMKDQSFLHEHMMNDIIKANMGKDNIDVQSINNEINKLQDIFLTNNLPELFKIYQFFKFHPNYLQSNDMLYNGVTNDERDKIMLKDLFTTELESDNSQLFNFLELMKNGDIAYYKIQNGEQIEEEDKAILAAYSDSLVGLYRMFSNNKIHNGNSYLEVIKNIKQKMNIQENENLGNKMLERFFEEIGFEIEQYSSGKESIAEGLLEYMKKDKEQALQRNGQQVDVRKILEVGDLIKGTDIQYLDEQLRLGIRSKEFYQKGEMETDATPFDTDFSEITVKNLKNKGLKKILNSTISSERYGITYYVIKKGDYDESKSYTRRKANSKKARYLRTAIGSNKISYIITSEWDEAYGYQMAQNGIYIPVIDRVSEEVLFTREQYDSIREKMRGLSFYRAEEFQIDQTALNSRVQSVANELRESAKGKLSTEEKREKLVEYIKSKMPKKVVNDMVGDLSSDILEFIDTGSTGRGTNLPGDGDFDFTLKCSSKEEQSHKLKNL